MQRWTSPPHHNLDAYQYILTKDRMNVHYNVCTNDLRLRLDHDTSAFWCEAVEKHAPPTDHQNRDVITTSHLEAPVQSAFLTLSLLVFAAASRASAEPSQDWQSVLKKSVGAEVHFAMWGGSDNINAWVDKWVAPEMKKRFDITVKRQAVKDPVDSINKLVSEKQAGKGHGSADLLWINGENFKIAKNAGVLFGPFTQMLPSFNDFYDAKGVDVTLDFGTPTEGYEAPYGRAQFVFAYDSAKLKEPPSSYQELRAWIKKNPGKFTYPAPPDFTGSAFVRQVMYVTTGGAEQYLSNIDLALLTKKLPETWAWLNDIRPYLLSKGATYPGSKAKLDQLFADGEIWLTMGYSPATVEADIRKGTLPKTVRTFVMKEGTIANTHFVAIPFNAPHRDAALVLANFLLSPEAQLAKFNPSFWGDFPALDLAKVPADMRKKFAEMDMGISILPVAELAAHRVPEIPPEYLVEIEREWTKNVAAKMDNP